MSVIDQQFYLQKKSNYDNAVSAVMQLQNVIVSLKPLYHYSPFNFFGVELYMLGKEMNTSTVCALTTKQHHFGYCVILKLM